MRIARFNNLFSYFCCSQLVFLPIYFYRTPLISETVPTDKAMVMHLLGILWSAVGYLTARLSCLPGAGGPPDEREGGSYSFRMAFYLSSYALVLLGTTVAVLQVVLFVPLTEYLPRLFGGDFEAGIREAFLTPSEEEGLPGIVKMFSYAPLSVYLMSLGLSNFLRLGDADARKLRNLGMAALVATVVKVFFSLDRLTIMAVLLANIFVIVKKGSMKRIRYWLLLALFVLLADYLSTKRLEDVGIVEFTLLYFKLGLVNFQLMIDTCSEFTYGFSTILGPLYYVMKVAGLPAPDFVLDSSYEWEWSPLQYFSSYAFQDYGYFYFILFYFTGLVLFVVDFSTLKRKSIYGTAIYFAVLYGVVSFLFVPAIKGVDFWFSLLLPLLLVRLFSRELRRREAELRA
ncbi:MAG TPA: hypothetical protein PLB96_07225 [Syntrophales bacterium]|nr:hypothetical protein [Syntrophales bacterium]